MKSSVVSTLRKTALVVPAGECLWLDSKRKKKRNISSLDDELWKFMFSSNPKSASTANISRREMIKSVTSKARPLVVAITSTIYCWVDRARALAIAMIRGSLARTLTAQSSSVHDSSLVVWGNMRMINVVRLRRFAVNSESIILDFN